MMRGDAVTTGGPYRLPADPGLPCKMCGHRWDAHKYMYSIGTSDRYRCEAKSPKHKGGESQCECGKQFEVHVCAVPPGTNPKDVMDAMARAYDAEMAAAARRLNG